MRREKGCRGSEPASPLPRLRGRAVDAGSECRQGRAVRGVELVSPAATLRYLPGHPYCGTEAGKVAGLTDAYPSKVLPL